MQNDEKPMPDERLAEIRRDAPLSVVVAEKIIQELLTEVRRLREKEHRWQQIQTGVILWEWAIKQTPEQLAEFVRMAKGGVPAPANG